MVFSYSWLKDYVEKLPKAQKLAELLTMHSFEVSKIKRAGKDFVLDIDVLPNRAGDCFSHLGVAREVAMLTNLSFLAPAKKLKFKEERGLKTKDFVSVEVKEKEACPRYTAKVVSDVKVGFSPQWLQDRLKVCGLNSINNVVDVLNYVMLETGQPIHAFDFDKISGSQNQKSLIVRFAKKREDITTLDGKKYKLDKNILVIADAKKPLALAGIKGGKEPEIDKTTKSIIVESANFDPPIIRKGSRDLGLRTDASVRFEHGIDPNLTQFAIERACFLIQKLAGGKVAKNSVDIYPKKVYPKRIRLELGYVKSLLGADISNREIKNILKKLGCRINSRHQFIMVEVPTFRLDVTIPEDLIEEIGRIYGYEKIPAEFPVAALVPPQRNDELSWENAVKDIFKEAGFTEVYNYSFVSSGAGGAMIEVTNPASGEYRYLRSSLMPGLLENVHKNLKNFSEIKIFELGKVFSDESEKKLLAGAITPPNFYYLKGLIDSLLHHLGISDIWYKEQDSKSALIKADGRDLGWLREDSFELDFESLQKLASEEHEYRPPSKFPALVRDLAILVPPRTKVVEVLNAINIAGGSLVRDVDLFDIYEGEELPEDKKNLAFHIIYQSEEKTLTSKEADQIHQKIIKALERNIEWRVRK